MRPLELGCIDGVWNSALSLLNEAVGITDSVLQLWYQWGDTWYGRDTDGRLPSTNLPEDLMNGEAGRFGGRFWKPMNVGGVNWLISVRKLPAAAGDSPKNWNLPKKALDAVNMLADFVRIESLFGMTLTVLEAQAKENRGHWDRIRNLSVAIAGEMNLSKRETADIEVAALLHDVGKIGLPSDVLEVARPLAAEEKLTVEAHSTMGAGLLRQIPGMEMAAEIIMSHHEAIDGSGYPRKLKKEEIPVGSLIIAVADGFDAMTHYRPYAIERTYQESFNELCKEKGKYSPEVLNALEKVLKRLGIIETKPLVGSSELW